MILAARLILSVVVAAPGPEAPVAVVIATANGSEAVVVSNDAGYPALPASTLARLLPLDAVIEADWAVVHFAGQPFRFLLDAPVMEFHGVVIPLVGGAYLRRDSLFVPLQWLSQFIPRMFSEAYRYDPRQALFEEVGTLTAGAMVVESATRPANPVPAEARAAGLRFSHKVVVDAGHGGAHPGNPGRYLPRGMQEKHVTLALAKVLQRELEKRGVEVVMTRTTDTLIDLMDRAPMCRNDCDLFVSLHVNSFANRNARGFETYFLDHAQNEAAARVAAMENEALRYEASLEQGPDGELGFIFQDLLRNAYLRESAQLADLIQRRGREVHPGGGRYVGQANFAVLRGATRPAVLVEAGYASNPEDGRFLASSAGQRRLAEAIADGIVDYLRSYELKTAASPPQ
jgi:N-acetylmuramoyl-L-alanine amidase